MCLASSCFSITNPYFCKPGGFLENSFLIASVQFGCLQSDSPHSISLLFSWFSCFVLPRILFFLHFTVQVPSLYTTKLSHGECSVSRGTIAEMNFLAEESYHVPSRVHCLCLWKQFSSPLHRIDWFSSPRVLITNLSTNSMIPSNSKKPVFFMSFITIESKTWVNSFNQFLQWTLGI